MADLQMMARADEWSNMVDRYNGVRDVLKGLVGDPIILRYDGSDFALDIDNPSGNHLTVGSGEAVFTDASVAIVIPVTIDDPGGDHLDIGSGKLVATDAALTVILPTSIDDPGGDHLNLGSGKLIATDTALAVVVPTTIDDPAGNHLNLGTGKVTVTDTAITAVVPLDVDDPGGNHADFGGGVFAITDTDVTSTVPVIVPDGSAGSPGLVIGEAGLGIYRSGTDTANLVADGDVVLQWKTDAAGIAVGIGVAPSVALHVKKDQAGDYLAIFENDGTAAATKGIRVAVDGTASAALLSLESSGAVKFHADTTGFVRIGQATAGTFRSFAFTVANNATATFTALGIGTNTVLRVHFSGNAEAVDVVVRGVYNTVVALAGPAPAATTLNVNSDVAGKINIYHNGSDYAIKNNAVGASVNLVVWQWDAA